MTMLGKNRSISMILILPEIDGPSMEKLEIDSFLSPENKPTTLLPIYQGSIIRSEKNDENEKSLDLIVRIVNFQSAPSSSGYVSNVSTNENEKSTKNPVRLNHRERFAAGIRHLTRVFATNQKPKTDDPMKTLKSLPMLPDVEVMPQTIDLVVRRQKKVRTGAARSSKIFFGKRKKFQIKRKNSVSTSTEETQTDSDFGKKFQTNSNNSKKNITFIDELNVENENQIETNRPEDRENSEKNNFQPIDEKFDVEERFCLVQTPNDDGSESYEITCEIDPQYKTTSLETDEPDEQNNIFQSEFSFEQEKSPTDYETLASAFSLKKTSDSNDFSSLNDKNQKETDELEANGTKTIFEQIPDDLSPIDQFNDEQEEILNVQEDYTVIIEFMKQVLRMDSVQFQSSMEN